MMSLKNLLTKNLQISTTLLIVFIAVAILGLADSLYLAIEHFMGAVPPCTISNCEVVLTSKYAVILGVPVSLLGAVYYGLIVALSVSYLDTRKNYFLVAAMLATHAGLVASIYFISLQAFVIGSWCPYCVLSGVTSTVLWLIGRYVLNKKVVDEAPAPTV